MAGPSITVEVAFSTQPFSTSPSWTDITQYVAPEQGPIIIQRGRSDELSEIQPSTLSLWLKNDDGRFTPGRAASPYYPNVKDGKRIRITIGYTQMGTPIVNLLRKAESDFEDGTVGNWVIGGGASSFVSAAELPDEGSRSGKLTADGSGGAFLHNGGNSEDSAISGNVGDSFTVGIRLRSASATRSWRAVLRWLTATNAYHSQTDGTFTSCGSGGYTQLSVSGTMPSGAAKVLAQWESQTTPAGGEVWHADKAQLTKTAALQTWEAGPTLYRRFDGHVNEWPQSWQVTGGTPYSPVQITATDRFKLLDLIGELRSILEEETLLDNPQAYYPLSEPEGSLTAASITKSPQSVLSFATHGSGLGANEEEPIQFGAGTGPGTDELSAVMFNPFDDANGKYLEAPALSQPVGGNGFTLEVWFRGGNQANSLLVATSTFNASDPNDPNNRVMLKIDGSGNLEAKRYQDGDVHFLLTSSTIVDDNRTHHAVVTEVAGVGAARLYLDGVEIATAAVAGGATTQYPRMIVGGNRASELYRGTIAHVAVYNSVLSSARILAHYNAGINGLAGDRTDQRIARIADYIGIPSADRALDVGDTTVGWQGTSGQGAVEAMRTVERTESGVLFMAGDTKLTFHKRSRRYNAVIGLTLDAQQADQVGRGLIFPGDDFGRANDATITRERNSPARSVNQASIDEFGLRRISSDGIHQFDSQAQANVEWIVNNYGDILIRVPTVECDLFTLSERNPSLVTTILGSEISTKARLSNLPTQAPFTPIDLFIEGSTETIGFAEWKIIFNCSPAIFSTVWQLDTAGFSELGVTTKLAY